MSVHYSYQDVAFARHLHFKKRIRERYGFEPTDDLIRDIEKLIEDGDASVVLRSDTSFPNNEFLVEYAYGKYRVIYNMIDKHLVTALPLLNHKKQKKKISDKTSRGTHKRNIKQTEDCYDW